MLETVFIKPLSGWLVVDKPLALSSAQVVGIIKKKLSSIQGSRVKIGHTGTLDPLATGILPLAIGEATKLSQFFLDSYKNYDFTIAFGNKTDTGDAAGSVIETSSIMPSQSEIEQVVLRFLGAQKQIPPKYSALKVSGKRAYDLARNNIDFKLEKREITIKSLCLVGIDQQNKQAHFSATCSKGTYIRTLGEDIAEACGSFGHLSVLRRTKVGFFSLNHAILPDICEKLVYKSLLNITDPLNGISGVHISDAQEKSLRFGQSILWQQDKTVDHIFPAFNADRQIVALVVYKDGYIKPKRIFNL